jgi:hypothetical protein
MNLIFKVLIITIIFILPKGDLNYNKKGEPSSKGIYEFISKNQTQILNEYMYKVDTLYTDIYMEVIDFRDLYDYDTLELSRFYVPGAIMITSEEKFVAFEFKNLSKYAQKNFQPYQNTVKGVIFHELTHAYVYQIEIMMRYDTIPVSSDYITVKLLPTVASNFGVNFIEEGICEYTVILTGEKLPYKCIYIPKTKEDILNKENEVLIKYQYSVYFLKSFLDQNGLEEGIKILLRNSAPTYDEILEPTKFFNRLK